MDEHRIYGSDGQQILSVIDAYAERLIQDVQWEEAVRTFSWVWDSLSASVKRIDIGIRWIDALVEREQHDDVIDTVERVTAAITELPEKQQPASQLKLEDTVIEWLLRRLDYEGARQRIEKTLADKSQRDVAQRIRLKNYLGRIALEQGQLDAAEEQLRASWCEAAQLTSEGRRRTANNDLGLVLLARSQFREAHAHFKEELALIRQWKDPYLEARCRYNLAVAAQGHEDLKEAAQQLKQAYDLSQPIGRHELTLRILNAQGNLANELGKSEEAIDCYERGLRLAQRLNDRMSSAALATNLGILLHEANRVEDAWSHLAHVKQLLRHSSRSPTEAAYLSRCLLEQALLVRESGEESSALEILDEAHDVAESEGAESMLAIIETAQEESAMKLKRPTDRTVNQVSGQAAVIEPAAWQQLLKINQQLAHVTDIPHLLQEILSHAVSLVKAEYGLILLIDASGDLRVEASLNVEANEAMQQVSRSMAQRVIQSGQAILTENAQEDDSYREFESVMLAELKAVAVVPVHAGGKVIGCLYLSHRFQVGAFGEADVQLLAAFADQAGIAIDRARLLGAARQQASELKESLAERDEEVSRLEAQVQSKAGAVPFRLKDLRSSNPQMGKLFALVSKVMPTDLSVFIHGATGTGKEVIARLLHEHHPQRSKQPFIAVSCGAIPKELMESELFGYKAGAFTGATRDKIGLFEAADGGTLFLDEIAELPLELQTKLLRVLQERELRRLGETRLRHFDCRILSASHQDLQARIKDKSFREDLYYRLCQIQIDIPPLVQRREDVPDLVEHFVDRYAKQHKVKAMKLQASMLKRLLAYDWPGNIRELENLVQTMCALSNGKELKSSDIPPHHPLAQGSSLSSISLGGVRSSISSISGDRSDDGGNGELERAEIDAQNRYDPARTWQDYEQLIIAKAYQHHDHEARPTAAALGISIAKLYKAIKEIGLKDKDHALYREPFHYDASQGLKDYLVKIFRAARQATGGKPYPAIRQLQVSPGFFYKMVPSAKR